MKQTLPEKLHNAAETVRRGWKTFRRRGIAGVAGKIRGRIRRRQERARFDSYEEWIRMNEPGTAELERQRKLYADRTASYPLISILVPVYRTRPLFLRQMIESVLAQTYPHWELILADGSGWPENGEEGQAWRRELEEAVGADTRIRHLTLTENGGIAGNTNAAYAAASGEWIAFLDHDDTLSPDALYRVVQSALSRNVTGDPVDGEDSVGKDVPGMSETGTPDLWYSDVDNLSEDGTHRLLPHFKPDYNLPLLCSMNYLCHFLVVRRALLQRVLEEEGEGSQLLRPGFEGAQDYDLILRCCERTDHVCHIPRVLYHWRAYGDSTAENPESKLYAFEAGKRAVQAHYDRLGLPGTVEDTTVYGTYQTRWHSGSGPKVSVLVPNRDQSEMLDRCLKSLLSEGGYENLEILILENGSAKADTRTCYERWQAADNRIRVLRWTGQSSGTAPTDSLPDGIGGAEIPFNYAAINNFGAAQAGGDYLLLLNNDTSIRSPGAVRILVETAVCEQADVVGARLFYPDDTIQHAGIYLGLGGVAGHAFAGADEADPGYFNRIIAMQELSAVTGACLLIRRDRYLSVGGMDEALAVAFNDVDLCLRVRRAGGRVLYNPDASLYHYESKSRGAEDTPEKRLRFGREIEHFCEMWEAELSAGDPFYNPNLSLDDAGFGLAERARLGSR